MLLFNRSIIPELMCFAFKEDLSSLEEGVKALVYLDLLAS